MYRHTPSLHRYKYGLVHYYETAVWRPVAACRRRARTLHIAFNNFFSIFRFELGSCACVVAVRFSLGGYSRRTNSYLWVVRPFSLVIVLRKPYIHYSFFFFVSFVCVVVIRPHYTIYSTTRFLPRSIILRFVCALASSGFVRFVSFLLHLFIRCIWVYAHFPSFRSQINAHESQSSLWQWRRLPSSMLYH